MPLYDYQCAECKKSYEELRSFSARDGGQCRHCNSTSIHRKIVRFRIGKQGDLRETSEFHGCHRAIGGGEDHSHEPGHSHGPGCGHGTSADVTGGGESSDTTSSAETLSVGSES